MEREDDLISVLICVYKEPQDMIGKAVNSILKQTYKWIEVVIVIDDPDADELYLYLKKICDDRILIIKNDQNYGLTKSLNIGLTFCHGSYICRMDADDISYANRIEKQYKLAKEGYKFVISPVDYINKEGKLTGNSSKIEKLKYKHFLSIMGNTNIAHHPTFFIESNFLKSLNGYDEDLRVAQDYDLILRAMKRTNIGITKKATVQYRVWTDNISHQREALQRYMLIRIQNNYDNEKPLDSYEKYKYFYEKYKGSKGFADRFSAVIRGSIKSLSFRKYIINTLFYKLKLKLYLR